MWIAESPRLSGVRNHSACSAQVENTQSRSDAFGHGCMGCTYTSAARRQAAHHIILATPP